MNSAHRDAPELSRGAPFRGAAPIAGGEMAPWRKVPAPRLPWRMAGLALLWLASAAPSVWAQAPAASPPAASDSPEGAEGAEGAAPSGDDIPTLPPTVVGPGDRPRDGATDTPFPAGNIPNVAAPSGGAPSTGAFSPAEQAVITPTREPSQVGRSSATVRVIDREAILRSAQTDVSGLLRTIPGVDVAQQGAPGGIASVFLRGANSQHTKVLVDGIPVNDPSAPSRAFDFSTLSTDNLERIEVLQGPQSLLYGSDAIGGVVNIITRRGEGPPSVGVAALGGSFGTHREAGWLRGGGDGHHYSLTGSWRQSDGFSAAQTGVERDGFSLGTVAGRFGVSLAADTELEYIFRWIDARAEIDDAPFSLGAPPTDDPTRLNLSRQYLQRVQLRSRSADELWTHQLSFDFTDYERDDRDDLFPFATTGQTRRLLYQTSVLLTEDQTLSAGAEYWAEDAGADGFGSSTTASQFQRSAFIQDQIGLTPWLSGVVGWRWDDHSAAGAAETYRCGLLADFPEWGLRVRSSLGTGFRAPALAENLFPFGNPALRPETSRGWELGGEQVMVDDRWTIGAVYFRNDLQNLILFDLATFTLENIGAARTHGVELVSRWTPSPRWFVDATYTRTDTLDGDTGAPLVRRPRDKASLVLTRLFDEGRGAWQCSTVLVGPRTDTRDGTVQLDEYLVVNLSGRRLLREGVHLTGRVDNLFDERYQEATGFATARLSAYAGLEFTR